MHAAVHDHVRRVKPTADNATAIRRIDVRRVQPVDRDLPAHLANRDDKDREASLDCLVFRFQCQYNKIRDVSDARLDHRVRMARPDLPVKTDRRARLAIPEAMVVLAVRDLPDLRVMPANRDVMVNQVVLVHRVKVALVDAKVPLEHQAKRAVLAEKVNVVQPATMVHRVHRVKLVSLAHREVQVPLAAVVNQASRAQLDHQEATPRTVHAHDAVSFLVLALKTTRWISRICNHNRHGID